MIKTFEEFQKLDMTVADMYQKDETLKDTKFGYHYKRICEKFYIPAVKKYSEEINDARVQHALEDEKTKEILTDNMSPRGFKYSKQGLKDVIKSERDIMESWKSKEIEFEPFISSHVPENLTDEQREILTGILI